MKVVIRADSALHIGTGHVMRCLVLAHELNKLGHDVSFCMWKNDGDLGRFVESKGYSVVYLEHQGYAVPTFDGDYDNWLPVTQKADAELCAMRIGSADIVIVDHYSLGEEWERYVKSKFNCQLFVIDDLKRRHHCDALLDQTLNRITNDYINLCPTGTSLFTGTQYALLNPKFAELKELTLPTPDHEQELNLLVSMGGIDNSNITLEVLEQLVSSPIPEICNISVIVNAKSPSYDDVRALCERHADVMTLHNFISDMASFMNQHQLAIGSPGGTTWERACLGLPSLVIPIADNQKDICQVLNSLQLAEVVARDQVDEQLIPALTRLVCHREDYANRNQLICDGLGAKRIASWLHRSSQQQEFYRCRLATTSDIDMTYQWQCLPETRRFALTQSTPTFEEHANWMTNKLKSTSDFYYIIEVKKDQQAHAAGVVRLDKQLNGHYVISIYISPEFFGRGIAYQALQYVDVVHSELHIDATVLKENLASQALFTKAGYQRINAELFERPPKSEIYE